MFRIFSKLTGSRSTKDDPPPPYLPQNRPRVLTPSASQESLSEAAISATASSAFFQKFPFEIRNKILRHAFGNKTMDMSLSLNYPLRPLPKRKRNQTRRHTGIRAFFLKPRWRTSRMNRKEWEWLSGVCGHCPPTVMNIYMDETNCDGDSLPGVRSCCETWENKFMFGYIGVMGWLLSCRQAYAECIDILYTTNTIYIFPNDFIIHQLPRVLLPQRLASITSVKMRWTVSPVGWEIDPFEWEHSIYGPIAFNSFLSDLPITFPHLISLRISLEGRMDDFPTELYDQVPRMIESHLMVPIDGMVRKLGPHIQKCHIALPASVYTLMKYHTENGTVQEFPQLRADWTRIWRELSHLIQHLCIALIT